MMSKQYSLTYSNTIQVSRRFSKISKEKISKLRTYYATDYYYHCEICVMKLNTDIDFSIWICRK